MTGAPMDRRSFVRRLPGVAGAGAAAAALVSSGCGGASYLVPTDLGGRLAVPATAVGSEGVFVAHPTDNRPIFVSRDDVGRAGAVHARCTHRGCQPEPVAGRLACPCHGSEFTFQGVVLEGPAREPLRRFTVTEQGSDVLIWLEGRRP